MIGPAWVELLVHPTVEAFYYDHGLSVREAYLRELDHVEAESPAIEDGEVRLVVSFDDDMLYATLPETGRAQHAYRLHPEVRIVRLDDGYVGQFGRPIDENADW